jgi:hypothetical protein
MLMRCLHALIIALGIVFAGAIIAGSNLWLRRYEYFYDHSSPVDRFTRVDRAAGEVYFWDRRHGWTNLQVP